MNEKLYLFKKEHFQRHGSMRKVIPADSGKENLFEGHKSEEIETIYKVYRQEYVILAEYKMVQNENIFGVYVIPSHESSLMWFGVIFVRRGFYEDGVFRFNILLDESFPDSSHPVGNFQEVNRHPLMYFSLQKVIFQSKIFHPVINSKTGELNLLGAFPEWNKSEQHLWQVLKYVQWIFYEIESCIDHAVNSEAAEMWQTDRDSFKSEAVACVKASHDRLYDAPPTDDPHHICFEPYSPAVHDHVRSSMLEEGRRAVGGMEGGAKRGLSWVLAGSGKSLTRPPTPHSEGES
ncbi:unnamed protein product [Phaedon cochleariae]|uniref:UBC core domain-containing protein n=1 Tax=Phaedon cochleariae TaxID=80249 RepID=A0A9N9SIX7_PHACE|nr:unnamed protein product [Phaedon cochleariae]